MIISEMRFDGFQWKYNPLTVTVTHKRRTSQQNMQGGSFLRKGGCDLRVIKGKGELAGADCSVQFKTLCDLFEKGRKGLLTLPFMKPFYAYFTDLSLTGEATPELITYTFEFVEAESAGFSGAKREYVCAKEEETLFDIAYREGVSVESLVALNPQIKRPDELQEGEEVRLC